MGDIVPMNSKNPIPQSYESKRIVREPERKNITGLSRSQWARLENAGLAPKRVKLSETAHGWPAGELFDWIEQRMAARQ